MRVYQFRLDGASPGPGVIVVIHNSMKLARETAQLEVDACNKERKMSGLDPVALDREPSVKSYTFEPGVVYFDSGER